MSRKDYEALAAALASVKPTFSPTADYDSRMVQWVLTRAAIADVLERDNPRFNRYRFMRATEE